MKVGVFFYTTSGNTEDMANALADGFKDKGCDVVIKPVSDVQASDIEDRDFLALGSPAQGTEEMDEVEFMPFYNEHKALMSGKKTLLFGSFGWGGGEYMNNFSSVAKGDGLKVLEVYTNPEAPGASVIDELKELAAKYVE